MNYSAKNLIRVLEQNGFILSRISGSHHLYVNPVSGKRIIVPVHGNKDLPKGTFYAIIKQAGIDRSEF
jgi:predicted RNA binding protein YcfA (HicA-like mRNA interferase family)